MLEVAISKSQPSPLVNASLAMAGVAANLARLFGFPGNQPEGELAKLLWVVRLRWLAVGLFFVLAAPAFVMGFLSRESMPIYLGVVGVLLVFNLLTQLSASEPGRLINSFWFCFQMAFDLCILTVLLSLTGGVNNPAVALLFLNVALGGLLIPGRLSWPFLVLVHTSLGSLQFDHVARDPAGLSSQQIGEFFLYHLLAFSFWFVMRSLGAHLEGQFERAAQARVVIEKQDRLRAIGALAAGFSHEFASPLNAAIIRLERARRERASEDVNEALEAVRACQAVVHQMNSSQMDSRTFSLKRVVVADLLADVVETWTEDHPHTPVRLEIEDRTEDVLPSINFAQVVLNLLDNADQAAPANEVSVTLRSVDGQYQLTVADRGPGFSEPVLNRLGEPFLTTKEEGTGLGLYVSQLFCQSLGGRLVAGPRGDGRGARVLLEWPQTRAWT